MHKFLFIPAFLCVFLNLKGQYSGEKNLMPVPLSVQVNAERLPINDHFRISITGSPDKRIYAAASRFLRRLGEHTGIFFDAQGYVTPSDVDSEAVLHIAVKRPGKLTLNENESYQLRIGRGQAEIIAETDLGAIHALETLLQLVSSSADGYFLPGLEIQDTPRFAWRGLLLDVALHFMPVDVVKRTLDGMALVKMNVLHLHLCNDQGFRVESKRFPQLQKVSSDGLFYTQDDIRAILQYANERGIRVVPEFVVPAHTTAILKAFPQFASRRKAYTLQRYFGVFDPVMDPTNENLYPFLDKLFGEMAALFPDAFFHIGGDENTGKDWESNPKIKAYMEAHGMKTYMDLQTAFNKRILPILEKYHKTMMGWDEILQPGVPKKIVIQSWRGKEAYNASLKKGYRAILSYGYYIDLIQPTDFHYLNDPVPPGMNLSPEENQLVLGGEATMWSELVSPQTVDSRIWPRTAAIAERLWSPQQVRDVPDMYRRLASISLQLESAGLTHLSYKQPFLRRLANGYVTKPVEVLVNVIEPLKIYERNQGDTMYTVFSPLTKLADVATPDQEVPRIFSILVDSFLEKPSTGLQNQILYWLNLWKENHAAYLSLVPNSPVLKEGEILSENLSHLAVAGLEAMEFLQVGRTAGTEWLTGHLITAEKAKEQGARCELQVVLPVIKLIKAAGGKEKAGLEWQDILTKK